MNGACPCSPPSHSYALARMHMTVTRSNTHPHTYTRAHHTQDISFHKSGYYTVNTAQITSMSRGIIFGVGKLTFALMRFRNCLRRNTSPNHVQVVRRCLGSKILCVGFCLQLGHLRLSQHDDDHKKKQKTDAINDRNV